MPTTTPTTKYIVVDDDDPRITYSGPDWFWDSGSKNGSSAVINGALHQGSAHATQSNGSVSFVFEGDRFLAPTNHSALIACRIFSTGVWNYDQEHH